jgi:hypothetical protein
VYAPKVVHPADARAGPPKIHGGPAQATTSLVDREGLPQARGTFLGGAFLEVGAAESLQDGCFLQRQADVAGDGECPGVMLPGLLGAPGSCR